MARAERKKRADRKKQEFKDEWLRELKNHVAHNLTYDAAVLCLAEKVSNQMVENPQEKAIRLTAWGEFFDALHAATKKFLAES